MKTLMLLLAFMATSAPTAMADLDTGPAAADQGEQILVLPCDGTENCPAIRLASLGSDEGRGAQSDSWIARTIRIEPVAGGFVVDGQIPEPLEVRLVSYLSDAGSTVQTVKPVTNSELVGLWTGGRVMYAHDCEASCAVIVQTRDRGEVLRAAAL